MRSVTDFVETRRAYEKDPKDLSINLKLALAYLERSRLKDAAPMVERVLKADAKNELGYAVQIYSQRASAQITAGEFDAAKLDIEKVKPFDPEAKYLPGLYFQMGYELGNVNQMDEAISQFEMVMKVYPESEAADDSRFFAGLIYFIQEKDDKAEPLLSQYTKTGKNENLRKHAEDRLAKIKERQE